ncbi:hypothetical protein ACEWY4_025396 [Coilia grayii]|uniref:Ras-GEF domain-containing protein n=1 Tax=Coilia grayii TaxID=363190 RepID=A0ABD1IXH2_9TELE
MPRVRKALRLLCCLRAVKDDVDDNLPVDIKLHQREELRRETCPQREIGPRKMVLGSDGIHTEEFPKTRSLNNNLTQQVLEDSRAEIKRALRSTGLVSDQVAGGEGTKTEIILKDVNASTVDIEENGKTVLVINRSTQVFAPNAPNASCSSELQVKFGTPAKILQFVLCRLDTAGHGSVGSELERAASTLRTRERVGKLVVQWVALYGLLLMDNPAVVRFLEGCPQLYPPLVCGSPLQINRPIRVKDTVKDVVAAMKASAADNVLVRMNPTGVKTHLKAEDRAISFVDMSERVFLCSTNQINKLVTLQDQLCPESSTMLTLKNRSSKSIAAQLSSYDWELFNAMHETELLYYVVGRHKFPNGTTANLERFIGRFNEVSFWVPTELLCCSSRGKRVTLLKKFIDIATM